MRGNKRKSRVLTFTILSNDANKVVTRFQIPKWNIILYCCLASVPLFMLAYFITTSMDQQAKSDQLAKTLAIQTSHATDLQAKVDSLAAEQDLVEEKVIELNKIESELQKYLTELPEEASGGMNISIDKSDIIENSGGTGFSISDSSKWIDSYKETLSTIEETNQKLQYIPTIWPTEPNTITSAFGIRDDPFNSNVSIHTGIDVRGKTGTPIYAGADGTVTMAGVYGGYGKAIIIRHSDTYQTVYGHLSAINVAQQATVKKGELIGELGSTGRSTGPHLHYEVVKNGEPVNPEDYINYFSNDSE